MAFILSLLARTNKSMQTLNTKGNEARAVI